MIELVEIVKRFGGVAAVEGVSLQILPGEVHGLLGENGAGKSTVMNLLFGLLRPDAGDIRIAGKPVTMSSPRIAQAMGIGMVHQHFKLVGTLTVVENLALALGTSVRRIRGVAEARLASLGWRVPLDARVEGLAVGQQQRVEIVKALLGMEQGSGTARTLILDEPTAVLTPQEAAELFTAVERLTQSGTAVVFISHKLGEIERLCDKITILRRGKVVYSGTRGELSAREMAERMVGAAVELPSLKSDRHARATNVLTLDGVTAGMARNISLKIGSGEIVGIAGVDGNGQTDLVQAIVGGIPPTAGHLTLDGEPMTHRSIRWRMERLAYIAEDRQRQAVVLPLTVEENLMLKDYRRAPYAAAGWLRFSAWRSHARELVQQFDVRTNSLKNTVGQLSGGNQQKVVLARELYDTRKRLVVAVNPTRGLDVGATAFVMERLLEARSRGAGVLLVHSDLDELLAIADRVLVMFEGRLVESDWPRETKEGIGRRMLGLAPAPGGTS